MENNLASGYYAIIPATILFNKELKANEKLLYAVITVLANKEGYCFASNMYLAELFNAKPHTISNWVSHLNKLGYVHVEIITGDKKEIIQRRIYPNDTPYITKMTYPYSINMTESMSQIQQYNNINNKIDRFFNYIIKKEKQNPEQFTKEEEIIFWNLLQKLELDYTEDLLKIYREENITKVKIIIYALKELFISNKRQLLIKVKRENLIFLYDKCKNKEIEYKGTKKEIKDFFEYYYISLTRDLEQS